MVARSILLLMAFASVASPLFAECRVDFRFEAKDACASAKGLKTWQKRFLKELRDEGTASHLREIPKNLRERLVSAETRYLNGNSEEAALAALRIVEKLERLGLRKKLPDFYRRLFVLMAMSPKPKNYSAWTVHLCRHASWKKHLPDSKRKTICGGTKQIAGPFVADQIFGLKNFAVSTPSQIITYRLEGAGIRTNKLKFPEEKELSQSSEPFVESFERDYIQQVLRETRPASLRAQSFRFSYGIKVAAQRLRTQLATPTSATSLPLDLALDKTEEPKETLSWLKSPWFWVIAGGVIGTGTYLIVDQATSSTVKVKTP